MTYTRCIPVRRLRYQAALLDTRHTLKRELRTLNTHSRLEPHYSSPSCDYLDRSRGLMPDEVHHYRTLIWTLTHTRPWCGIELVVSSLSLLHNGLPYCHVAMQSIQHVTHFLSLLIAAAIVIAAALSSPYAT